MYRKRDCRKHQLTQWWKLGCPSSSDLQDLEIQEGWWLSSTLSDKLASMKSQNSDLNPTPKKFKCPWLSNCREAVLFLFHFLLFGSAAARTRLIYTREGGQLSFLVDSIVPLTQHAPRNAWPTPVWVYLRFPPPPQEPGKLTGVPLHWECLPYSLSYVLKAFSGGSSVELIGSLNETTCLTFMAQHWPHQQIAAVIILTALRLVRTCLVRDSNKELILWYLI